jgi:protein-tyrosine phosphatase
MRRLVAEAGLEDRIAVESSGTGSWHVGHPPDRRATAHARRRGITMGGRARRFDVEDFARLDLILAMDAQNAADLRAIAPDATSRGKIRMLREFDPAARGDLDVPDPYYGGGDGFTVVLDMVEDACRGLLERLRAGSLTPA